ncbi:MAG TPA: GNAT family N-acetyltransferase [Micromonosporaceae bacterium]|nr:GNAT family N-acetyltransferase [Micromonosporaceae bacterium]
MNAVQVVRAEPGDAAVVAALVAEAFESLAVTHWLVPDPAARRTVLAADMAILVEHALELGHIDMVEDRSAAAVWFQRGAEPVPPPPEYERRLAVACGPWSDRFRILDALFEAHKPRAPHHHLALLAVTPARQGTGLGSALLRHHHRYLDRQRIPAYLEASSVRSRYLYRRHGYLAGPQFTLPEGPPLWPMWREPIG